MAGLRIPVRLVVATGIAVAGAMAYSDPPVLGLSADLVISQVYGGGGGAGATYQNDFVEIFNRGGSTVSLDGKSIQYASATGTGNFGGNPIVSLSGSLAPGQYYLVQLAGGATGAVLPTPDTTGTIAMAAISGKVALVNSTAGLACNGGSAPCSPAQTALIIDLVGYGTANYYEAAATPAISVTTSAKRMVGGCTETDNNQSDFEIADPPLPRNTATALAPCTPSGSPIRLP